MSRRDKDRSYMRSGPGKYVSVSGILLIILSVAVFPVVMVLTAVACNLDDTLPRVIYSIVISVLALGWLTVYGFYTMRVSLGTVLGLEMNDRVVYLHTKRKIFTYDVKMGCVAVKVKGNKFICTFETQDSRDKFIFYRHAPFSKYSDKQFTEDDISAFCPAFEGEDYAKERGTR